MWVMALRISRTQRSQLLEWAEAELPHECCGLLLGRDDRIAEVRLSRNVADNAAQRFEIDPVDLIAAHKAARMSGSQLLGHFHSHPNGLASPSPTDLASATDDGSYWLIIAQANISAWQPVAKDGEVMRFREVALIVEG
jgi:desampylase